MNHEKLMVYRELLSVAEDLAKRVATWPRGYGYLRDQLMRALASALLTLAEGNGKRSSKRERRRFFEMSMGSVAESAACLDLAHAYGIMHRAEQESFKSRLRRVYVMIEALP